ncbi:MAG: response regulator transcription factor [Nitrospiraceae bacterium]
MKPRVIIADDHVLVAQGIQRILEASAQVVKIVADGRALLQAVQELNPDIVVVDISLPLLNGLDAARQIKKSHPKTKLLVLTMHDERTFVVEAFQVGVSGYVLKQSVANEVQQAVETVLKGQTYISPAVAQELVDHLKQGGEAKTSEGAPSDTRQGFDRTLSPRQREVLQLVAEGRSTKEIASILNVSIKTIEFHRTRIMKGLGVKSRPELTKYAIANGMIPLHGASNPTT